MRRARYTGISPATLVVDAGVGIFTAERQLRSPNQSHWAHWRVKHQDRTGWQATLKNALVGHLDDQARSRAARLELAQLVTGPLPKAPEQVYRVEITRIVPRPGHCITDEDNLTFCVKPLLDALVSLGVIYSDRKEFLDRPQPEQIVERQPHSDDRARLALVENIVGRTEPEMLTYGRTMFPRMKPTMAFHRLPTVMPIAIWTRYPTKRRRINQPGVRASAWRCRSACHSQMNASMVGRQRHGNHTRRLRQTGSAFRLTLRRREGGRYWATTLLVSVVIPIAARNARAVRIPAQTSRYATALRSTSERARSATILRLRECLCRNDTIRSFRQHSKKICQRTLAESGDLVIAATSATTASFGLRAPVSLDEFLRLQAVEGRVRRSQRQRHSAVRHALHALDEFQTVRVANGEGGKDRGLGGVGQFHGLSSVLQIQESVKLRGRDGDGDV